jgi:hypothetical protein
MKIIIGIVCFVLIGIICYVIGSAYEDGIDHEHY